MSAERAAPSVVIVMGVSGAGKTAVGQALADALDWPFHEGDDYHSPENVRKMTHGQALTDADRAPWLAALHALIQRIVSERSHGVLACSALKHAYRKALMADLPGDAVRFVFLDVPAAVLEQRLGRRVGHFMPPELLPSQLATLEIPRSALRVDGTLPIPAIVARIRESFGI
jgi:gluconokinase